MIRLAKPSDAEAILEIYAPYIRETSLTFETEVPTIESFANRINSYMINYPWLVMEIDGNIAGYAYAARHRERTAYQWSVECSVYIHNDHLRKGIGSKLYQRLFHLLKSQGFTTVYAVINLPNDRSVAMHERAGFTYFTTYENVGFKLGAWKNVGWWFLKLNDFAKEPAAPLKLSELGNNLLLPIP